MTQIDNSGLDGTFGLLLTFGGSLLQQLSRYIEIVFDDDGDNIGDYDSYDDADVYGDDSGDYGDDIDDYDDDVNDYVGDPEYYGNPQLHGSREGFLADSNWIGFPLASTWSSSPYWSPCYDHHDNLKSFYIMIIITILIQNYNHHEMLSYRQSSLWPSWSDATAASTARSSTRSASPRGTSSSVKSLRFYRWWFWGWWVVRKNINWRKSFCKKKSVSEEEKKRKLFQTQRVLPCSSAP